MNFFNILLLLLALAGCVGKPPFKEYNLAEVAIQSAQEAKADEFASGLWLKAEEEYRNAKVLYENRDYDKARVALIRARRYAEKAENTTRLKKFQSGGGL